MSHNAQRINDKEPNAAGNIPLALGDLNDVTLGTLTNNHILGYSSASASWTLQAPPASSAAEFIFTGDGSATAYPVSTFAVGDPVYFIENGLGINTISGATLNYLAGSEGVWVESVTLPAGKWSVNAQTAYEFSSTGYLTHAFKVVGGSYFTNIATVGSNTTVYGLAPTQMQGILQTTAPTTIQCVIHALSSVSTTQAGFYPSLASTMLIRRLQ